MTGDLRGLRKRKTKHTKTMGLFNRPAAEAPQQKRGFTDVIQNEGNNTGRGLIAWRDPHEDFNTNATLVVNPGEEAVFVNRGDIEGVFPPGSYVLKNQNVAIIRSFREALSGGRTTFPCRVFFVSTEEFNIKWGTMEPIGYTCPVFGPGVQLHGYGEYLVRVADSAAFIQKMVRDNQSYTDDDLSRKLVEYIYTDMAEIISRVLEENGINAMEVSKKVRVLSEQCQPRIQKLLDPYGIQLLNLSMALSMDEEQRQMYENSIRQKRMDAQGEAQARQIEAESKMQELNTMGAAYRTIKGVDILKDIANNPGGGEMAGMGAGMGMGMAAGNAFGSIAQNIFAGTQPAPQPSQQDPMEVLKKMKQMLDAGLINQQQYDAKVAEVMSRL